MTGLEVLDALKATIEELAKFNQRLQKTDPESEYRIGEYAGFASVIDIIEKLRRELIDAKS